MRISSHDKFFVFLAPDKTDTNAAQKLLEGADGIEIVDFFSGTFRVRTTQIFADAFKIAHDNWTVSPEQYIPLPRVPRFGIKGGPE